MEGIRELTMALAITKNGEIRKYELLAVDSTKDEAPNSGKQTRIRFKVYNNTTNEYLFDLEFNVTGANATTLYTNVKSTGIRNYYVSLCTELGVSTAIVPANMENEWLGN